MSTNLDNLTPFDMQVLNMARLQIGALEWTQTSLSIPNIGVLEVIGDGRLQIRQSDKPSRWCRALSKHGSAALGELHWELLSGAIDTDARDAEVRKEIEERRAEMRAQMGLGQMAGGSAAAINQMQQMRNQQLAQLGSTLGMAQSHAADAMAYAVGAPAKPAKPAAPAVSSEQVEQAVQMRREGFSLNAIREFLGL